MAPAFSRAFLESHTGTPTMPAKPHATLNKYATVGCGPMFESLGRRPPYKPSTLVQWVESRPTWPRRSTSEPLAPRSPSKAPNLAAGGDKS
jgi:hypothetical protein